MVGWHHRLDGHEFEQAPGVGDGQGGLACSNAWGRKELDMTEQLNNNVPGQLFPVLEAQPEVHGEIIKVRTIRPSFTLRLSFLFLSVKVSFLLRNNGNCDDCKNKS